MAAPSRSAPRNRVIWVLNAACPSRCTYCDIASQRRHRPLSTEDVRRVAGEVVDAGFEEVTFVGGEPLLSPDLPVALEVLAGRVQVAVFTGGIPGQVEGAVARLAHGVDRVVFSLDSGEAALNDLIRGRPGITEALLALAEGVHRALPDLGTSVNTVVSRHNAGHLWSVWARMRALRPSSWSLTLAGDNFSGQPTDALLSPAQLETFYLHDVPALAGRLRAEGRELVVLPVPYAFLAGDLPPAAWADAPGAVRAEAAAELSAYARGAFNEAFVSRCGCPLVGLDITIGVDGQVHPCSQAPAIQPAYAVGDLRHQPLAEILSGPALTGFAAGVPHPPCTRCWAPSNVPRALLRRVVSAAA